MEARAQKTSKFERQPGLHGIEDGLRRACNPIDFIAGDLGPIGAPAASPLWRRWSVGRLSYLLQEFPIQPVGDVRSTTYQVIQCRLYGAD
jgi:hypothetical protein